MREQFIEVLKKSGATHYLVREVSRESYELYYVHKKIETARYVDTLTTTVTIYKKVGNFLGSNSFYIYPSTTVDEFKAMVEASIKNAEANKDPLYSLVKNERLEVESDSNFKDSSLKENALNIAKAIFGVKHKKEASLNATEIFVHRYNIHIFNSENLDKREISYEAFVETIPTFTVGDDSVEIYESFHLGEFNEADIQKEIALKLNEVEARYNAKKPEKAIENVSVMLRKAELTELFSELTSELRYEVIYQQMNVISVGERYQSSLEADSLTITMRGHMHGVYGSAYFDRSGSSLEDTKIIEVGEAINAFGDNKHAQFLKKKVTGNLSIVDVEGGSLKEEELKDKKYLECLSFSGIQVDIANDYVGGEVRLALLHDGDKVEAVTGISIAAKLSDILNNMHLATEVTNGEYYHGPAFALFDGFTVL